MTFKKDIAGESEITGDEFSRLSDSSVARRGLRAQVVILTFLSYFATYLTL